jgi:Spy/CpxP family protein refolding chaperone
VGIVPQERRAAGVAISRLQGDASMRIERIILATVVALLIAIPAMAQDKPKRKPVKLSPTAQAMMRMAKLWETLKQLDLSAEQEEKLKEIRDETAPKMKPIMDKMGAIVTEEQKKAFEEAAKKAREEGKKGRDFFLAVQSAAELTDEQKEKLNKVVPEIRDVHRQMMKSIMGMLTPEQKEKMKQMRSAKKKKAKKAD